LDLIQQARVVFDLSWIAIPYVAIVQSEFDVTLSHTIYQLPIGYQKGGKYWLFDATTDD